MSNANEDSKSMSELRNEPVRTGRMFLVKNPEKPDGADIHHEKFMFGEPFDLDAGESKEMDETVAKAACYVWGFLKMTKPEAKASKPKESKIPYDYTKE